ncbi:MAG: phosphotransferase [Ignavibacteriae bacterium]|nr:phosphotransferase [Ignavibacteriota bacterium]
MKVKEIEKTLKLLFRKYFFEAPDSIKRITGGVSGRLIYKIKSKNYTCIGVHNAKLPENRAFIEFSKSFGKSGLPVPQIYCVSDNPEYYLEEFLGEKSLFELTANNILKGGEKYKMYRQALKDLIRFQLTGKDIINYRLCYETRSFDKEQIYFDFDKFNNFFLRKFAHHKFTEKDLSEIKKKIFRKLTEEKNDFFMYRDFQPRNIMYDDGKLSYIDYQSGRKGPLHYDLASFLYSGSIHIDMLRRKVLLNYYLSEIGKYKKIDSGKFRKSFYNFALIRLIQVLGSYGYLYEKNKDRTALKKINKAQKYLKSIIPFLDDKDIRRFAESISRIPIHT